MASIFGGLANVRAQVKQADRAGQMQSLSLMQMLAQRAEQAKEQDVRRRLAESEITKNDADASRANRPPTVAPVDWKPLETNTGYEAFNPQTLEHRPLGIKPAPRPEGTASASLDARQGRSDRSAALQVATMYNGEPAVKDANIVASAVRDMRSAAAAGSPGGDMKLIYKIMKVYDPNSSVREGEYATGQNAGSVPTRIQNAYNKAIKGQFLTPELRADFVKQAESSAHAYAGTLKTVQDRYRALAAQQGIDATGTLYDPLSGLFDAPSGGGGQTTGNITLPGADPLEAQAQAAIAAGADPAAVHARLRQMKGAKP